MEGLDRVDQQYFDDNSVKFEWFFRYGSSSNASARIKPKSLLKNNMLKSLWATSSYQSY